MYQISYLTSAASSSLNTEDVFLGVKLLEHETDNSPISVPRLRILELYLQLFTPFLGVTLIYIKHRDFTLSLPSADILIEKVKLSL
jgi:hypothetical protein